MLLLSIQLTLLILLLILLGFWCWYICFYKLRLRFYDFGINKYVATISDFDSAATFSAVFNTIYFAVVTNFAVKWYDVAAVNLFTSVSNFGGFYVLTFYVYYYFAIVLNYSYICSWYVTVIPTFILGFNSVGFCHCGWCFKITCHCFFCWVLMLGVWHWVCIDDT